MQSEKLRRFDNTPRWSVHNFYSPMSMTETATPSERKSLYLVYATTRNSAGFMTRKLSVTVSHSECH